MLSPAPTVDDAVERLCLDGCKAVRRYIQQMENNSPLDLLTGLSPTEKQRVLQELRDIMEVYERCELSEE